ncbi:uncharacterized protein LOC134239238 [Saccostrea cucullata]|uniref:uncharacterized protein LOC134239238 n=1 Tax=Saccostrea cuccullata TaxID=36930 RepID=UPI002ECFD970
MPVCSCKQHLQFAESETFKVYRIASKKFKAAVVDSLVQNGHLSNRPSCNINKNKQYFKQINVIMPFSFSVNLLIYYISNSKTVCNHYSAAHPAGSYSSLINWIEEHSTLPIIIPSKHDIITFFDNNQVLARNWRVRYDAKAILSVITTIIHIFQNPCTDLQIKNEFSPRNWFYNIEISEHVSALMNVFNFYEEKFRSLREKFIKNRLAIICSQQHPGLTSTEDALSSLLVNNKKMKFSEKSKNKIDAYCFIDHHHKNAPKIQMGNPISVNPCSYESVEVVLSSIKAEVGIPENRKWTLVGCDGLPFLLSHRIIKHSEDLQDLLILPGLGHFEINMCKALIKLVWQALGVDLAKLLGYRSPKALQACLDGNDHHKAMQFLEILLLGTGDELLYPYVKDCFEKETVPSTNGYFTWCKNVVDPNYKFIMECIFTYALAVYLFRAGVRRNNSDAIMASRIKFCPLYFGVSKTNYQQI